LLSSLDLFQATTHCVLKLQMSLLANVLQPMCMHYIRDNEMMKKMSYFVEIKFHLNENTPWHCMQLELIWIEVKFSAIQV
jgi:hypothetical protein